jgi:hypothetical protein
MATIGRLMASTHLVHGMNESEIKKIVDLYLQVPHQPPWIDQEREKEIETKKGISDTHRLFIMLPR